MPTLDKFQVTKLIRQENTNLFHQSQWKKDHHQHQAQIFSDLVGKFLDRIECWKTAKKQFSVQHTATFGSNCLEQDNDLNEEVSHWCKAGTKLMNPTANRLIQGFCYLTGYILTTSVRQTDGRYETGLLLKDKISLPDNRSQTSTHLNHFAKRQRKKPEQYKKYNEGIQADLEKASLKKYIFNNRKTQDGRYHTMVLSAQTNLTWYGESAMPTRHKAEQASMTNSKLDRTISEICLNFATILSGSNFHPGWHRSNVYAN